MPRQARRLGNSGYYHVIMRGIDRHILFEDETDHRTFLSILKRCRREESVTLCAFCLMSNHLHLLLNCPAEHLARFIKKIGVHYSAYFNGKYDRVGHLFQDRFKSERPKGTVPFGLIKKLLCQMNLFISINRK